MQRLPVSELGKAVLDWAASHIDRDQPQPESGSEEPLAAIADELRAYPEVRWDRFIEYDGKLRVYGWLDRSDGRADFLFDAATGRLLEWITSAHPHPASVVERLEGGESVECQRVEDTFDIPNVVRLQPESSSGEEGERAVRFDLPERLRTDDLGADLADELRTKATHLREAAPEEGSEQAQVYDQAGMLDEAAEVVEWAGDRLDAATPTQPLQGSEVERIKRYEPFIDKDGHADMRPTYRPHGYVWDADYQAQLQRVEGERDEWRQRSELVDQARGNDAVQLSRTEQRATQAEARIQEAAETFDRRAHNREGEANRLRDKLPEFANLDDVSAATYRNAAKYLRSQSSTEVEEKPKKCACGSDCRCESIIQSAGPKGYVCEDCGKAWDLDDWTDRPQADGEGHLEELTMIALALKNQGIERVTPELDVEILIERLYPGCPDCKQGEGDAKAALAWALGWIEHSSEVPLEDVEPDDFATYSAGLAILRGDPASVRAGRCVSCGTEVAPGSVECERCAAAPPSTPAHKEGEER